MDADARFVAEQSDTARRLLELIDELSLAHSAERIIRDLRRTARKLARADGALLALREGEACHYHGDAHIFGGHWRSQRCDEGICSKALLEGKPDFIDDVRSDPRMPRELARAAAAHSLLMAPIRAQDPLGVIAVYWQNQHRPSEEVAALLQALANATAPAFEAVRAHRVLERQVNEHARALRAEAVERQQAEQALSESHARLSRLIEAAMDAIISIDAEQRIVLFNAAASTMFRCPAAQALGSPLSRFIPERLRATHLQHVQRFLDGGNTARRMGELRALVGLRADGEEFPIEASISKVQTGQQWLATVIVRDISARQRTEQALRERGEQLAMALQASRSGAFDWDPVSDQNHWTDEQLALYGLSRDEFGGGFEDWIACVVAEDRAMVAAAVRASLARGRTREFDLEFRIRRQDDGDLRWMHGRADVLCDADGRPRRMIGINVDITERRRAEEALRESEARLQLALEGAQLGVWDLDLATGEISSNPQFLSMLGYRPGDIPMTVDTWMDLVHPDDLDKLHKAFSGLVAGETEQYEVEFRQRHRSGDWRWILSRARVVGRDEQARPRRVTGIHLDISERKEAEETIRRLSLHDPLTGLPNRALAYEFGQHLLAASTRGGVRSAVMFIDLDRFKPINDTYGHAIGDAVLKEVATRLMGCMRREDIVGRLGGDEFIAVLSHIHARSDAARAAEHVLARLSEPYRLSPPESAALALEVSPSIGISIFPDDGGDIETLIARADTAMYQAKAAGRARVCFYGES